MNEREQMQEVEQMIEELYSKPLGDFKSLEHSENNIRRIFELQQEFEAMRIIEQSVNVRWETKKRLHKDFVCMLKQFKAVVEG